jgi:uncharacterized membrane protein
MREPTRTLAFTLVVVTLGPLRALGAPPPLICYGNEPSWRLDLTTDSARLSLLGEAAYDFAGRYTSVEAQKAHAWRGRPATGAGGDLVAFVTEAACSDGMSDERRPYSARVSLSDGRLFAGCCRLTSSANSAPGAALNKPTSGGASPSSTAPAPAKSAPDDWTQSLVKYIPAIKACVFERMRTEAVMFATMRPEGAHLVLRLPGQRYVDCDLPAHGTARINNRPKGAALGPGETAAVLTFLPGEPPRDGCYETQPALDERGDPFAWISRKC